MTDVTDVTEAIVAVNGSSSPLLATTLVDSPDDIPPTAESTTVIAESSSPLITLPEPPTADQTGEEATIVTSPIPEAVPIPPSLGSSYHLLKDYGQLDLTKLTYAAAPDSQGLWAVRYGSGQQRLVLRTPVMLLSNVTISSRSHSLDLSWPPLRGVGEEHQATLRQFHDLINIVDIHHITNLSESPLQYQLAGDVNMSEVDASYIPAIRKSGYTFDDCLKFFLLPGEVIKIFDLDGQLKTDSLTVLQEYWRQAPARRLSVIALCCLEGLRKRGEYFQSEWQIWQLKIKFPV